MNNSIEMVLAERTDIPEICRIASQVWGKVYSELLSPEQISYMMDMMYAPQVIESELENGYLWYLVKLNGSAVGYVSIFFKNGVCKLDKIYLHAEVRRSGIGRAAIGFVKSEAKKHGAKTLILNVNKYNRAAQQAYTSYGFKHLRDEVNDIGGGFVMDDFVLSLDIE